MKASVLYPALMSSAILLSSLYKSKPALAGSCPAPSFAPTGVDVAVQPGFLAVGDFNADGKPDLVVAGTTRDLDGVLHASITMLLGSGDASFQVSQNFVGGNIPPRSVVVADVNGDGVQDLIVAYDYTGGYVAVMLGTGDGTFQDSHFAATRKTPWSVTVGDFNSDGKADLALANFDTDSVSVLLGTGDGTFPNSLDYKVARAPIQISAGDFNGDGKADLAVVNLGSDNVSILLGIGDGTFQRAVNYSTGIRPLSMAVGDINGDGKLDLAVANQGSFTNNLSDGGISVLLGSGDGTFQPTLNYSAGTGPNSVVLGDFNGDRKADLIVSNQGSFSNSYTNGSISVLSGRGDGSFETAVNYAMSGLPGSVVAADLNGNGTPDIAVSKVGWDPASDGFTNGSVSILLNTCDSAGVHLAIVRGDATVTISWPFLSSGYLLEFSPSLSSTKWQASFEAPIATNRLWQVTVPSNQGEGFFRLRKP